MRIFYFRCWNRCCTFYMPGVCMGSTRATFDLPIRQSFVARPTNRMVQKGPSKLRRMGSIHLAFYQKTCIPLPSRPRSGCYYSRPLCPASFLILHLMTRTHVISTSHPSTQTFKTPKTLMPPQPRNGLVQSTSSSKPKLKVRHSVLYTYITAFLFDFCAP